MTSLAQNVSLSYSIDDVKRVITAWNLILGDRVEKQPGLLKEKYHCHSSSCNIGRSTPHRVCSFRVDFQTIVWWIIHDFWIDIIPRAPVFQEVSPDFVAKRIRRKRKKKRAGGRPRKKMQSYLSDDDLVVECEFPGIAALILAEEVTDAIEADKKRGQIVGKDDEVEPEWKLDIYAAANHELDAVVSEIHSRLEGPRAKQALVTAGMAVDCFHMGHKSRGNEREKQNTRKRRLYWKKLREIYEKVDQPERVLYCERLTPNKLRRTMKDIDQQISLVNRMLKPPGLVTPPS